MTISGAYGRDYKSKAAIEADLLAGKDFVIRDFGADGGRYVNLPQLQEHGIRTVNVRYKADRNIAVIKIPAAPVKDGAK